MNYQHFVESMSPAIYASLKQAIELGKWPDGKKLTPEQKEHCLQAVIAYDLKHKPEQERVGYIYTPKHEHCGSGQDDSTDPNQPQPLNWAE